VTADQFNRYAMPALVRASQVRGLGQAADGTQPQAGVTFVIPGSYFVGAGVLALIYFMWRDSKFNK